MRISMVIIGIALLIIFIIFMIIVGVRSEGEEGKEKLAKLGAEMTRVKLNIINQPWTGWTQQQPIAKTDQIEMTAGQVISLSDLKTIGSGDIAQALGCLKVEKIFENGVIIITNGLAESINGGMDLRARTNDLKFTLKRGEIVKLGTQTMDAGNTYTISFLSASN